MASSSRLAKQRSEVDILQIPTAKETRRISLTAISNGVIDDPRSNAEEQSNIKIRLPSFTDDIFSEFSTGGYKQGKYSVALQTLKPFRPSRKDGKLPINTVGLFSYVFLMWLNSLVWKFFKRRKEMVSEDDIWQCSDQEGFRTNTDRMVKIWLQELNERSQEKVSFVRVWYKFIRTRVLVAMIIMIIHAVSTFLVSGLLLQLIVSYLETKEESIGYALGLIAAVLVCEVVRACSFSSVMIFSAHTGRSIYFAISIINIFGVDSYRAFLASCTGVFLLALPIYLIIGAVYTYTLIGLWFILPIAVFVICYCAQTYLTRWLAILRRSCSQHTDKRVRRMGELLDSIRLIKLYAWEIPFKTAIKVIRKSEEKYLMRSGILNNVIASIIPTTPTISTVVTIAAYSAAGNRLTASTAFALVGTMNFLKIIVSMVPFALRSYSEAKVSFGRLTKLLLMEEFVPPPSNCSSPDIAVELRDTTFQWEAEQVLQEKTHRLSRAISKAQSIVNVSRVNVTWSSSTFQLSDFDLIVNKGSLIGICGVVGSGKSSLLSAILGRMDKMRGHLAVNGSVAYVPQQAWIFNASIKENILFGAEFNKQRYEETLSVCGLEPDLEIMPDGDETEIGERGTTLSGGQKQRVNLARAVYSNSDIYLLDDPLSAVDVRVGKQLFYGCIKDTLKGKTVILVTHQLQYLKHCDEIIVMDEGKIVERGHQKDLLDKDGNFAGIYRTFQETSIKTSMENNAENNRQTNGKPRDDKDQTSLPKEEPKFSIINGEPCANGEMPLKNDSVTKRILVQKEESSVGDISFGTFRSYVSASGGWFVVVFIYLVYILSASSIVFSDWWLSEWISTFTGSASEARLNTTWNGSDMTQSPSSQDTNVGTSVPIWNTSYAVFTAMSSTTVPMISAGSGNMNINVDVPNVSGVFTSQFYLLVYGTSLVGILFLQVLKSIVGIKMTIRAASSLHNDVLDKVVKAPMKFFEANPAGRVLNRFSKDLDEADVFLPQSIHALFQIINQNVLSMLLTVYYVPWILIAAVPIVAVYWVMKSIMAVSTRQLKRLENVSRSPLLSHVTASAQGLSAIVTYKQEQRFYETYIVSIMQFLVRLINETEARFTSIERINEYKETLESEKEEQPPAHEKWPEKGAIIFSRVVMKYKEDAEPVLKNIDLDILPGEKVGIIGRTGAGKSSLATVLFRLVELSGGHIHIDGFDISLISLQSLRSKLSTIPQDPVLFAGTVRWILVLDEATANIDTGTDAIIQSTIKECFGHCTVLTIAHRLNTVLHSDKIVVMDAGKIMECGSPDELLSNPNSFFNAMISSQTFKTPSS
ncbi:hypothetical protein ACJMK2_031436 [Sinanodonta woodiana]|uniref:Uncharacterized protein n=1 Tax=Sinanodonta woodiana TaxID=1069815 RepID=A0ABD3WYT0_SINWO